MSSLLFPRPAESNNDLAPLGFYVPVRKSLRPEREHGADLWTIEGVAASEDIDQQEERLFMSGMDFSPFLKSGITNWNHQDSPDAILGQPLEADIKKSMSRNPEFYVRGFLYDFQPKAQALWTLLEGLEKGGTPINRGIGWSVQGGVTDRRGNDLIKSVVRHCALTHEPVNALTWAKQTKVLAKSLARTDGETLSKALGQEYLPFLSDLVAPCPNGCIDDRVGVRKDYHGLLDHLVLCKGIPVSEARDFVTALMRGE